MALFDTFYSSIGSGLGLGRQRLDAVSHPPAIFGAILGALLLVAGLTSSTAFARGECEDYTTTALERALYGLERRHGIREVEFKDQLVELENPGLRAITMQSPGIDVPLGFIHYIISGDGKSLAIEDASTRLEYRDLRVNEALLEHVLEKMPSIETICTRRLTSFNETRIRRALAGGKTLVEAFFESPAYRARARLGFSEIIPESIDPFELRFCVRRPTTPMTHPN